MRISFFTKIVLILSICVWQSCRNNNEANELDHHHDHGHAHEHGHHHDGDEDDEDEDAIVIAPEKAEKLGIVSEEITKAEFQEAIKVGGQITAPPSARRGIVAKTSGIVNLRPDIGIGSHIAAGQNIGSITTGEVVGSDAIKSLQVEYNSTKAEMERMKPLYEQGIISAKDYNAAKTAFENAQAALGNITPGGGASLTSPGAGTLVSLTVSNGEFVDAGQTIGYIGDNSVLTLRADLPKRYQSKWQLVDNAFILPGYDAPGFLISDFGGKKLDGNMASNENISGFLPVYFSFTNNGTIDGNSFVETYLLLSTKKEALSVPTEALIEQQGEWFVYVQLDEDCYEKRPVKLGGSNGERTEITGGLEPGENVVVKGATFVKLAESTGAVPEGHTHNH